MSLYKVWRAEIGETAEDAREYEASDAKDAAEDAAEYDHARRDAWEWTWPVVYTVRDPESGQGWLVEVDREMRPTFTGSEPRPEIMEPSVHVLCVAYAICSDIRLSRIPNHWPTGQTWIELQALKGDMALLDQVTCEKCKRRAPERIAGLAMIGAW